MVMQIDTCLSVVRYFKIFHMQEQSVIAVLGAKRYQHIQIRTKQYSINLFR